MFNNLVELEFFDDAIWSLISAQHVCIAASNSNPSKNLALEQSPELNAINLRDTFRLGLNNKVDYLLLDDRSDLLKLILEECRGKLFPCRVVILVECVHKHDVPSAQNGENVGFEAHLSVVGVLLDVNIVEIFHIVDEDQASAR